MGPLQFFVSKWARLALSATGICLCWVLSVSHVAARSLPCGASTGCDAVAKSPQSIFLGAPVAFYGLLFYVLLFSLVSVGQKLAGRRFSSFGFYSCLLATLAHLTIVVPSARHGIVCPYCVGVCVVSALATLHFALLTSCDVPVESPFRGRALGVVSAGLTLFVGVSCAWILREPPLSWNIGQVMAVPTRDLLVSDALFAGEPDAPLAVVVFVDMQCDRCHQLVARIDKATTKARFSVWIRHFPLHPEGSSESLAIRAEVGRLTGSGWSRFKEAMVAPFERSPARPLEDLPLADRRFLDAAKSRVVRDRSLAVRLGLEAVPTVILLDKAHGRTVMTATDFEARYLDRPQATS